ncbi:MAG: hypothetical protein K6A23_13590 [Butyrivibrio sp.]|nr:hypothetical protein [Butyrivibrio sp.]
MKKVYLNISLLPKEIILGNKGENKAREYFFDLNDYLKLYGAGRATLYYKRFSDETATIINTVDITENNSLLPWVVSNTDTSEESRGYCQIKYTVDSIVKLSDTIITVVKKALSD